MHYWPIQNRRVFGGALPGRPGIVMAMAPSPAFALRKGSFAPIAQKAPVMVRKTFPEAWLWEDIVEDRYEVLILTRKKIGLDACNVIPFWGFLFGNLFNTVIKKISVLCFSHYLHPGVFSLIYSRQIII